MAEIGIFAAKVAIFVIGLSLLIILIASLAMKAQQKPDLEIEPLHKKYKDLGFFLKSFILSKKEMKAEKKKLKEEEKKEEDSDKSKKVFVIHFKGDIKAHQVEDLREEVTAILQLAQPIDEVVACVESPGGVVHGYGLCASQLLRFRERNIPLTVCVDKVAASGGYMMACVANKIIAAPFAIIGSIGVLAQVPNFNRLLKKHDVDYKEYTAGEYKKTISILGEITEKGEQKFLEQMELTHGLFKSHVQQYRPQMKVENVATGEYWYGKQALDLGLIDRIQTSDDYLLELHGQNAQIYEIKHEHKQKITEKIADALSKSAENAFGKIWERLETQKFI
ncbi:MAG: protease SohB [Oligoflexia bacterium]|nr:MAG: protease SohB [Oligoflexia bacterium]